MLKHTDCQKPLGLESWWMLCTADLWCPPIEKSWTRCVYHWWGPWCYKNQSHFTLSRLTATRTMPCRCGLGNTPRLCCAPNTQIAISQPCWECLSTYGQKLPPRSCPQLSYRCCPSNYSMETAVLYRQVPVTWSVSGIHEPSTKLMT